MIFPITIGIFTSEHFEFDGTGKGGNFMQRCEQWTSEIRIFIGIKLGGYRQESLGVNSTKVSVHLLFPQNNYISCPFLTVRFNIYL